MDIDLEREISVECKCGNELVFREIRSGKIEVEPCQDCMKEEFERGREEV